MYIICYSELRSKERAFWSLYFSNTNPKGFLFWERLAGIQPLPRERPSGTQVGVHSTRRLFPCSPNVFDLSGRKGGMAVMSIFWY